MDVCKCLLCRSGIGANLACNYSLSFLTMSPTVNARAQSTSAWEMWGLNERERERTFRRRGRAACWLQSPVAECQFVVEQWLPLLPPLLPSRGTTRTFIFVCLCVVALGRLLLAPMWSVPLPNRTVPAGALVQSQCQPCSSAGRLQGRPTSSGPVQCHRVGDVRLSSSALVAPKCRRSLCDIRVARHFKLPFV